jgi:hypothetical protein
MNFYLPNSGVMANNTWHYVVAVGDSNGISMWVNGEKLTFDAGSCGACTTTANGTLFNRAFTGTSMQIGAWSGNGWNGRGGVINHLRLTSGAIYPSTQATVPVPTATSTALTGTKLLITKASISPVVDSSTQNQTLTITGTVGVSN